MSNTINTELKQLKNEYARKFYNAKYQVNDNMTSEEIQLVKANREKRNRQRRKRYDEDKELRERQKEKARERYRMEHIYKSKKVIKIKRSNEENKV